MKPIKYDFGGYATKANMKCADGRIILPDAFKDNNDTKVPLVWQHMHSDPKNILGYAYLEHRADGMYAYGVFNDTEDGINGKKLVEHGDITSLSIFANSLVEKSKIVAHGIIREVSLVLSGANPGARIDFVTISHADGSFTDLEDEAVILSGEELTIPEEEIKHEEKEEQNIKEEKEEVKEEPKEESKEESKEELIHVEDNETIEEVFDTLSEKQKIAVYAIIGQMKTTMEEELAQSNNQGDENTMKHNIFENGEESQAVGLTPEQFQEIVSDARRMGSFKDSLIMHATEYGIDNIEVLFPDAQTVTPTPDMYGRDMSWVRGVIDGTRHSPFSRVKSNTADITADDARAKGYVKGALKKDEIVALLSRTTTPTTVYKKQKLDRDDIVDITDLDVVAWLKAEMRVMLDEELARAVLVGDGRDSESPDKIDETHIRPIYKDADMYVHRVLIPSDAEVGDMEDAIIRSRSSYKGSGAPVMYTTSNFLTDLLLQKDLNGRRLYSTEAELSATLRVSKIVEVPVMDNVSREVAAPVPATYNLKAIIVNLKDYTMGADKGGAISLFDDFDIDYNQYKYLLETRCSGALTLPKSAVVIEMVQAES